MPESAQRGKPSRCPAMPGMGKFGVRRENLDLQVETIRQDDRHDVRQGAVRRRDEARLGDEIRHAERLALGCSATRSSTSMQPRLQAANADAGCGDRQAEHGHSQAPRPQPRRAALDAMRAVQEHQQPLEEWRSHFGCSPCPARWMPTSRLREIG